MVKKIETELIQIAEQILKLKGNIDVNEMHKNVNKLYETLTVLKYTKANTLSNQPTLGSDSSFFNMLGTAFNNNVTDTVEVDSKTYVNLDDSADDIMEPVMEKIKDMVAQMPHETQQVDDLLNDLLPNKTGCKNDFKDVTSSLGIATTVTKYDLNDFKFPKEKEIINQLFKGSRFDYNKVLAKLKECDSYKNAVTLIKNNVKVKYNNWIGLEQYETLFLSFIKTKFS